MKTMLVLIVIAVLTYFHFRHEPVTEVAPAHVALEAPTPKPIIVAVAPDGSLENRWKTGLNAQTDLSTGASWK